MKSVDPVAELQRFVREHATQRAAAKQLGVSPAYLSDMLNKRRDLSAKILARLGLKTIVVKESK